MLSCLLMDSKVPDALQVLLKEVVDADLSLRLQKLAESLDGISEVRVFLMVLIKVVNDHVASDQVKLTLQRFDLAHGASQRALNDLNI